MKNKNGFKPSACSSKKCICCNPAPPTLSKQVIKNLGVQFCKMDEEELNDQALMSKHKKKKTASIARKATQVQQETVTIDGSTGRQAEEDDNAENEG